MTTAEILGWSAGELGRRIANGEVSSREATRAVLDALDGAGRELTAVARLRPEAALAQADVADSARGAGQSRGPLHGVPLAHKDMFPRAGELAEFGTTLFAGHRPAATASVINRLDAAGAIDVGRLNMVEFALGITGHNPHTGHPRNALDRSRLTGGSSSGPATAVAGGLVPAALGSDTGGSIRVPAALCGLVGIKPTYGRVSRFGAMPLSFSLDHVGPLARNAEDCALVLAAIAGRDPADPTTSSRPVPDYASSLNESVRGVRVARVVGRLGAEPDAVVAAACDAALEVIAGLGTAPGEVELPDLAALGAFRRTVMLAECAAFHRDLIAEARMRYNPQTVARMTPGFAISAVDYGRALMARGPFLERFVRTVFAGADVIALPTCPITAPSLDATDTGGDARFVALSNTMSAFVGAFNYLGLPALSLPVGTDHDGLPIGLQLVGRPFAEPLLLRLAHAFAGAADWKERRAA